MPSDREISVGRLAARSGVAVSALHFYEAKGLIRSRRTAGNQRRFARDVLRRVAFIRVAQRVGIPLKAIKEALSALPDERTPTVEDWTRLSTVWRSELEDRIRQLERLRDGLTECIGCGCLSLDRCALANPGDAAANRGPGSRLMLPPRERSGGPGAAGPAGGAGVL
ncbi:redox-sensitive transcriptional activator SoxR [Streptosporangium violaceochromogenes]|nr:redox-sensitive transcriptional activator SoxR [Streptosporangium violaceochromogenes]